MTLLDQDGAMLNGGVSEGDVLCSGVGRGSSATLGSPGSRSRGRPGSYDGLWSWSVEEPAAFLTAIWDFQISPVISGNMPLTMFVPKITARRSSGLFSAFSCIMALPANH